MRAFNITKYWCTSTFLRDQTWYVLVFKSIIEPPLYMERASAATGVQIRRRVTILPKGAGSPHVAQLSGGGGLGGGRGLHYGRGGVGNGLLCWGNSRWCGGGGGGGGTFCVFVWLRRVWGIHLGYWCSWRLLFLGRVSAFTSPPTPTAWSPTPCRRACCCRFCARGMAFFVFCWMCWQREQVFGSTARRMVHAQSVLQQLEPFIDWNSNPVGDKTNCMYRPSILAHFCITAVGSCGAEGSAFATVFRAMPP